MKKLSTLLSILVLVSMALSACQQPTPQAPTSTAPEKPADTPVPVQPTNTPEPALGEPLKIGVLSDLSGGLLLFGNEMWEGLQIGFEYATGGAMVAGNRPIELIIKDDTSNVDVAAAAARELIESEGVEILIGNSSSAVATQIQQIAHENDIVYFAAPAASHDIVGKNWNEHTFRVCRDSAQDALTVGKWAVENVGKKYLILAEDYAFGQATAAGFQATFSALGGEFLTEQPIYAPSDTTDFTPYIQQILAAEPDGLILIWATNTSAQILFQQLTSQGVTEKIRYITGFSSNDLTKLLPAGNVGAVGLIVYHYSLPKTEANDYLTEKYQEKFQKYPDLFSECGFATAQAVVEAINQTGGDASSEKLIAALEGLTFEGPKGTYTIRPEDHQALAPMYIVRLMNVDDLAEKFFELISEVSAEDTAPPCSAPTELNRCK
jgi:branched-chain amino acid transport system substrate-binding protein